MLTQHLVVAVENLSWSCCFPSFLTSGHRGRGVMRNGNVAWIKQLFGLQGRSWKSLLSSLERSSQQALQRQQQEGPGRLGQTQGEAHLLFWWLCCEKKHLEHMALYPGMVKPAGASGSGQVAICGVLCSRLCSGYSYVLEKLQNPMLAFKCQVF